MAALYPSLPPRKVEKPPRDRQRTWTPPGSVTQSAYERKKFLELFKRKP